MTSIIFPTSFRGKSKFVIFVREDIFLLQSGDKVGDYVNGAFTRICPVKCSTWC